MSTAAAGVPGEDGEAGYAAGGEYLSFTSSYWDVVCILQLGARQRFIFPDLPLKNEAYPPQLQAWSSTAKAAAFLSATAQWLIGARNESLCHKRVALEHCVAQQNLILGTARILRSSRDEIKLHGQDFSRHAVVQCRGQFFKIDLIAEDTDASRSCCY